MPSNQEKAAIIIGLCTIVAAIIGAYHFCDIFPSLCGHPLQVKITDPHNGEKVVNWITVSGTIDGVIPVDNYLWLLVGLEPERQWWPQTGNIIPTGQDWEIRARIGGGGNESIGLKYKLVAMLVDGKVNEEFNDWMDEGKFPPIKFPLGKVLDEISVVKVKG
jgi:hypothetical protein